MADEETEALRSEQLRRAVREERLADQADQSGEAAEHERRAEKARYLQQKLEERADTEE